MRPWYRFVLFAARSVGRLLWGFRVEGLENVPASGPILVTSNHLSNLDPPLIAVAIPREIGFVAKKELFSVPVLGPLIRSVNALPLDRSRLSLEAMDRFGEFLGTGRGLLWFPEGTRSRSGKLGRAKVGVGILLARHPVVILPVTVAGTNTPFRSLLRRGHMRVVFGRPHVLPKGEGSAGSDREDYRRIADTVLERIRRLQEGSDASERGAGTPATESDAPAGRTRIT